MGKRVIYWFRTDLRLHDSPALDAALKLKPEALYPVWTWDPHYVYNQAVGANRWQFLLDSMKDVSDNIKKVNKNSQLFVVRGPPQTVLPALWKEWDISDIVWEKDDDLYTIERDKAMTELAEKHNVKVHTVLGHTLWDAQDILNNSPKKKMPTTYNGFMGVLEKLGAPAKPIDAPTSLPDPGQTDLSQWKRDDHSVDEYRKRDHNKVGRQGEDKSYETFRGPNGDFGVPTMEELGFKATSTVRGGESRALKRFEEYMKDEKWVAGFRKPQTSPAQFDPPATTQLSAHLKFGTLSCRKFYWTLKDIERKQKNHSQPPESLAGQLLWREFYHANQFAYPNYNRIRGNPVSKYISWALQTRYDQDGNELPRDEMEQIWKEEEPEAYERFMAWKEGRTGFPWIDALMRQLHQDGWIHHLGRHSLACFLTRGQLYISWERGAEVFDRFLIDWDPSLNSGNWMWLSASAYFAQFFRVYSPATYGQKSDKHGALIRKYCPELDGFSDKHIYEPWKASEAEQKKAKCVLGKDYPERIVDDKEAKSRALVLLKAAYDSKLHGDDERVLNGTADEYINTFLPDDVREEKETIGNGKTSKSKTTKRKPTEVEEDSKQTKLKFAKVEKADGKKKRPNPAKGAKKRGTRQRKIESDEDASEYSDESGEA
ncbi:hypothetical protein OIO90_002252 [Microbotryomycetes sp. JL221]|nr:hypothetical protein OIO90_002252 [Microbotryomycetes sp. JL221]